MARLCDGNAAAETQYYSRLSMHTNGDLRQQCDFPLRYHVPTTNQFAPGSDVNYAADVQNMDYRQPPMQIDEALRQHCSISARRCFVAVIKDDGSPMIFSGLGNTSADSDVVRQFFDLDEYQRVMECLELGVNPMLKERSGFDGESYMPNLNDSNALQTRRRKRPRAHAPPVFSVPMQGIEISDSQEVRNFYEQRFKDCQQEACKFIAKAWVKAVEPKKQSTHPYTGRDEKAPEWWPKPWGPTKEEKVRHKEPDHLYKHERVDLLSHILRMVVEPKEKQHPDIQKLNLNVKKLEEVTTEALSAFFADKGKPANNKKKPYLNEIFKVAKQEERFKKREINGTTTVYVIAGDKIPETYSENDDDDQDICDDDEDISATKPSPTQSSMPPKLDFSSSTAPHGMSFPVSLPVPGTQYTPMILGTTPEQRGFVNGNTIPNGDQNSVHQTSRKYASDNLASTNLSRQTGVYYQQWSSSCTSTHQTGPSEANPGSLDTEHSIDGLPRHYSTEGFQAEGVLQQLAQTSCGDDFRSHCGRWF